MITLLHPGFLYAAMGIAAGIVALHFLATQEPRTGMLPTVRFFPDVPVRATRLKIRPSDALLLALRVLTALLVGAAFAQPVIVPTQRPVATIVAIVPVTAETEQGALPYIGAAGAVVRADGLSPALILALREASRLREGADSVELVVVSTLTSRVLDAASLAIRSRFPGRIRLVRVGPSAVSVPRAREQVRVEWADSGTSPMWMPRSAPDTVSAIGADGAVLIHPFARRWSLATPTDSSRVFARWMDGEPAAVERLIGSECVRSIGFHLPATGDVILRPDFARFVAALTQPCGEPAATPLGPEVVEALQGPAALAPASAIPARVTRTTPMVPWLLAAALIAALIELWVRRRQSSVAMQPMSALPVEKAA